MTIRSQTIDFLVNHQIPECIGVYIIHHKSSERPLYIGSSVNLRNRLRKSHKIARDLNRYDRNDLSISMLKYPTERGARIAERKFIKKLRPTLNECNRPKIVNDPVKVSTTIERSVFDEIMSEYPGADVSKVFRMILTNYIKGDNGNIDET